PYTPLEIPQRWTERVRRHIVQTAGEERGHLVAHDFPVGTNLRLDFPDRSFACFRYAFHLHDPELREVAVFTGHCGYHVFPADELRAQVLKDDRAG
ncbi:MAG TPA: hypothetical protein VFJ16_13795, partial [Longimicrobium sp.]|nr:hypothetical protein [Longimicrobium sp.]